MYFLSYIKCYVYSGTIKVCIASTLFFPNHKEGTRNQAVAREVEKILSLAERHITALSAVHITGMAGRLPEPTVPLFGVRPCYVEVFWNLSQVGGAGVDLLASKFNPKLS